MINFRHRTHRILTHMSYSLNSLQGEYVGQYSRAIIKVDTKSLDNNSYVGPFPLMGTVFKRGFSKGSLYVLVSVVVMGGRTTHPV